MASKAEKVPFTEQTNPAKMLNELQEAGFTNMLGLSSAWIEAMGDMSAEVLGFIAERIKEDIKTQHEILNCKDVGELQHIQAKFVQKAIDQYQTETGKLVEMGTKMMTAKPAQKKS